jgi:hypothetical protein
LIIKRLFEKSKVDVDCSGKKVALLLFSVLLIYIIPQQLNAQSSIHASINYEMHADATGFETGWLQNINDNFSLELTTGAYLFIFPWSNYSPVEFEFKWYVVNFHGNRLITRSNNWSLFGIIGPNMNYRSVSLVGNNFFPSFRVSETTFGLNIGLLQEYDFGIITIFNALKYRQYLFGDRITLLKSVLGKNSYLSFSMGIRITIGD